MIKKLFTLILSVIFVLSTGVYANASQSLLGFNLGPEINAEAAVVIDSDTGAVIYDKNMNDIHFPASITKIMTCLLAIENSGGDYEQRVDFSYNAVMTLPLGTSHIAMNEGETLTLEECLYGLMLESANDVANGLAEYFADTNEKFSLLMTERAKELGATNTNFTNPHGLHDSKHYTTAYDMALIMRAAIQEPEFIKMITTRTYFIPPTERQSESRPLNNGHKMVHEGHKYYNEYVIGGKTGFTDEAGNTLVTYAKNGDMNLICVVLKEPSSDLAYKDTQALMEYGFNAFEETTIFNASDFTGTVSVVKEKEGGSQNSSTVDVYARDDIAMFLPDTIMLSDIERVINLPDELTVPVNKDMAVGSISLSYNGVELASAELLTKNEVQDIDDPITLSSEKIRGSGSVNPWQLTIGLIMGIFALIILYIRFLNAMKRKRHRQHMQRRRECARRAGLVYADDGNRNYRYRRPMDQY
ncbi:MAG: D-alanyl-D-alanine carboxypeptidase [Clostridiales bacterium]|jgi:D-alanyl-D-alanine carboxypeptidase|nr:D-alanyl-D-alanine carboxypeptidase [Clostridiales bacterium]